MAQRRVERDRDAVAIGERVEVQAARVVERDRAERLRRLAGDLRERPHRREADRAAQVVVGRHPVIASALDVKRPEVDDALEAAGRGRGLEARRRVGGVRPGDLEQDAAQRVVDLLVVVVLRL